MSKNLFTVITPLDKGEEGKPYTFEKNAAVVPADILDRLADAIQKLDELEQEGNNT